MLAFNEGRIGRDKWGSQSCDAARNNSAGPVAPGNTPGPAAPKRMWIIRANSDITFEATTEPGNPAEASTVDLDQNGVEQMVIRATLNMDR